MSHASEDRRQEMLDALASALADQSVKDEGASAIADKVFPNEGPIIDFTARTKKKNSVKKDPDTPES